jgi:hypothetical protein
VRLRLGEQFESLVLWPPLHDDGAPRYQDSADSWQDIVAGTQANEFWRAVLRPRLGGVPAHVTWRLAAPTDLVGLRYGGSFYADLAGTDDRIRLLHAWDGVGFLADGVFDAGSAPTRDGRLYAEVDGAPPGTREVWLRYELGCSLDAHDNSTGLQDALLEVRHLPRDPVRQPVEVTFCWTEHREEGDLERRHTQLVAVPSQVWTVNVGGFRDPTMNWVRVNLRGHGPDGGDVVYGYADGEDVGAGAGYDRRRYLFDWLDIVSRDMGYTVSRPAAVGNPDTDGAELTDGNVTPPTVEKTGDRAQGLTALWDAGDDVVVTLDLEQPRTVAALRVVTHQPDADHCHAARIEVALSADGASFVPAGVIRHDDVWSPPGDVLPWERSISPDFATLPAGGNLAHAFWLPLASPQTARRVECRFVPQAGRGLGISEIQVLSRYTETDWPDREAYIPSPTAVPAPPDGDAGGATSRPPGRRLRAAPNPFNAGTVLRATLPRAGRVDLRIHDVAGRRVRTLLAGAPRPAGPLAVRWDGDDDRGRPLPSGVYFARLRAEGLDAVGRLTLLK